MCQSQSVIWFKNHYYGNLFYEHVNYLLICVHFKNMNEHIYFGTDWVHLLMEKMENILKIIDRNYLLICVYFENMNEHITLGQIEHTY